MIRISRRMIATALATGSAGQQGSKNLDAHRHMPGERPSEILLMDKLDPAGLGQILALYEHKVYVMASIWDINPFDQWGVEMGKKMAESVHTAMEQGGDAQFDTSTNQLLQHIKLLS